MQDLQQVSTLQYLGTGGVNTLGVNTANPKIKTDIAVNTSFDEEEYYILNCGDNCNYNFCGKVTY